MVSQAVSEPLLEAGQGDERDWFKSAMPKVVVVSELIPDGAELSEAVARLRPAVHRLAGFP